MTRRLLAPLAAAVLVLGIAACGPDEPEPRNTDLIDLGNDEASDGGGEGPSDGGGESPSDGGGDPSEVAGTLPDIEPPDLNEYPLMHEHSIEGAEQAFRYFSAVSMWAHQAGDTEVVESLYSDTCAACVDFHSEVYDIQEHKEAWSEFEVHPLQVETRESAEYGFEVEYEFVTGEHTRWDPDAAERHDAPEIWHSSIGQMDWDSDSWVVAELHIRWEVYGDE